MKVAQEPNFNCKDLKQLDTLWVNNSKGYFGYSVQKKIYLASGNSLDFDWEKVEWKNRNLWYNDFKDFTKSVGWRRKDGEWKRYEELPMNLSMRGELPSYIGVQGFWGFGGGDGGMTVTPFLLQRLVNCSR
ncbi:GUN4 domain-containing protein [Nostoc sp. NMS4]|uniref:GUN4 domain-containing protein n=1 Tax=Nostoc sp. NMS4 TaxID=2815390 RepID=UPI0025E160EC|nr:GUN4 domain-containing protein [Nostoc sp. NMS4]